MTPFDQAAATDALNTVSQGGNICNMRDCHSQAWGASELAERLESTDHKVEWIFEKTKLDFNQSADGELHVTVIKTAGGHEEWDDGYLVTKLPNINALRMGQKTGAHIKFGLTPNPEDTNLYENGFYVGLFPEKKMLKGAKGRNELMGRYELSDSITLRVLRGGACILKNDQEEPFSIAGPCEEHGTSMHGLIHIRERDSIGDLVKVLSVALVDWVDLNANYFCDSGIERLAPSFETPFTKVWHLDLGTNRIQDEGAERIAQMLRVSSCQVKILILSNNEIGDKGAAALAESISKPPNKVKLLHLADNQIGDEGAIQLAEAMEGPLNCDPKVTTPPGAFQVEDLDLSWNLIQDEGIQRLCQSLSKPETTVTKFALDHNKCTDKKTKKMLVAIMSKVDRFCDTMT